MFHEALASATPLGAFPVLTAEGFFPLVEPVVNLVLFITLYALFVFKFYRFIARKDIFRLNLAKYNTAQHPALQKMAHGFAYFLEHIFLFPFFMFFWVGILSALLLVLSHADTIGFVLPLSIAFGVTIRITAYYNEELSVELAKLLPLTLLAIFLIEGSFSTLADSFFLVQQLPLFSKTMLYYLGFATLVELILRSLHVMFSRK